MYSSYARQLQSRYLFRGYEYCERSFLPRSAILLVLVALVVLSRLADITHGPKGNSLSRVRHRPFSGGMNSEVEATSAGSQPQVAYLRIQAP